MANKQTVELDQRTLDLKIEMDQVVEKIKELDMALAELSELYKARAELLKEQFDEKEYNLQQKKEQHEGHLRALFEQVPQNETKTQRKVKLLSGDVIIKKSKLDFSKDNEALLKWAQANNREELINRKEVLSFKWADFKKNLLTTPNGIVAVDTGEVLDIPGLEVVKTEEKMEIKY